MLISLLLPAALAQEGLDVHGFQAAALDGDLRDPLEANRPAGIDRGDWHLGGLLEYADRPLVVTTESPDGTIVETPVVDNLFGLDLSTGIAPADWLRFDLLAPFYFTSLGRNQTPQGAGLGDLRLSAVVAPWQPGDDRKGGFGLVPYIDLPTGNAEGFLGESGVAGGVSAIATRESGPLTLTGNVGLMFQPEIHVANLNGSDALTLGAGVGWLFSDHLGATLELDSQLPFVADEVVGRTLPTEALLSARYRTERGGFFTLGGASALSEAAGVAAWRLFAGGGFGRVNTVAPVIVDTDGDGILDDTDACVNEPETVNDLKDNDGCPDGLPSLAVRVLRNGNPVKGADVGLTVDGGAVDNFPVGESGAFSRAYLPGKAVKARATLGACWAGEATTTTGESDGTLDVNLARKEGKVAIEVVDEKGKPIPNADIRWERDGSGCLPEKDGPLATGSGTVDSGIGKHTMFVSAPGFGTQSAVVDLTEGETETVRLVLKPTKVAMEAKQIAILDVVYFEVDQDVIKSVSYPLLDEVANVIRSNPDAGRVEIGGHTDSDADDAHNLDLSQRRAEAVRKYLIEKGVSGDRLIAKGYGESQPLKPNNSAKNKAKNRRVEFKLIDAPAAGAAPEKAGSVEKGGGQMGGGQMGGGEKGGAEKTPAPASPSPSAPPKK